MKRHGLYRFSFSTWLDDLKLSSFRRSYNVYIPFHLFMYDIIHYQAKRKRIAELSFGTAPVEVREKSQWDFVLEEMAWLANDFAQVWSS